MSSGNLLQEFKLRLVAPPQDNADSRNGYKVEPNLVVGVRDNQPRLTVYTGVVNDKNQGRIEANMDSFTFFALLEGIRSVARKERTSVKIANENFTFPQGKRSEKPMLVSTTYIGRDENGLIFIAVLSSSSSRPKIRFVFGPREFHSMLVDGSPITPAEQSDLFALGYCNFMHDAVMRVLGDEFIGWEAIKARKANNSNNRGNGGGYNNNNGGNNGGGNNNGGGKGNSGNNSYNNNGQQDSGSNDNGGDNDIPW